MATTGTASEATAFFFFPPIRSTIANLEEMDILSDSDREAIFHRNVSDLLGLGDRATAFATSTTTPNQK